MIIYTYIELYTYDIPILSSIPNHVEYSHDISHENIWL